MCITKNDTFNRKCSNDIRVRLFNEKYKIKQKNKFSISWDSTDDEINHLSDYEFKNAQSTVASRTRSHTPPHHDRRQTVIISFFFKFYFYFVFI